MKLHGSTTVEVIPCGAHPLHVVKVRASGARSGCPMCEMQIEDLCRSFTASNPRDHSPQINRDASRIVGCTCGWRTPTGTANSDDVYAAHIAIAGAGE